MQTSFRNDMSSLIRCNSNIGLLSNIRSILRKLFVKSSVSVGFAPAVLYVHQSGAGSRTRPNTIFGAWSEPFGLQLIVGRASLGLFMKLTRHVVNIGRTWPLGSCVWSRQTRITLKPCSFGEGGILISFSVFVNIIGAWWWDIVCLIRNFQVLLQLWGKHVACMMSECTTTELVH